jgi:YVTN family beta-propeller protein
MKQRQFIASLLLADVLLLSLLPSRQPSVMAQGIGTTTRVSVATNGAEANNGSHRSSISSADGRYVAFLSDASNLVSGDTNGVTDIFVRDRQTNQTSRVSVASNGTQANNASDKPFISADGRYVVFVSSASNLVSGDTNGTDDVFVRDRQTNQTSRVSVATGGIQANSYSDELSISADGRYVAFESSATNLVSGDTNNYLDIYVHDRQTNQTSRVSVATNGAEGNNPSSRPAISADGRYVVFESGASNLVSGDTNGVTDVFVRDRQTNQTSRVSVASNGSQGNSYSWSYTSAISTDGRYVAFSSNASNLVSGDTNGNWDVFVRDRQTNQTSRVSVATGGTQGSGSFQAGHSGISADGRYAVFESYHSNLVNGDTNGTQDIFVHDRQTNQTSRVSVASNGIEANSTSYWPTISGDGRYVAFVSGASNLVSGDTNGYLDIFVHDRGGDPSPSACFSDEFTSTSLTSGWAWVDPLNDANYSLTASPGKLRIHTSVGNNDFDPGLNTNGPRLVQAISGNFDVNTRMTATLVPGGVQIAGLLVWFDTSNFLFVGQGLGNDINTRYIRGGQDVSPPTVPGVAQSTTYFRFTRSANTFTTYYSLNGSTWTQTGSISYPSASTTAQVGMFALNQWVDNPITADFDYFRCSGAVGVGQKAFVAIQSPDSVAVLNTTNDTIIRSGIAWQKPPKVGAITPNGTRLFIAGEADGTIYGMDTNAYNVVATIPIQGGDQRGIAIAPNGTRLYVADNAQMNVTVINLQTNSVVKTIPLPSHPERIALSPDGSRLYVAANSPDTNSAIDTSTNAVVRTFTSGGYPSGIAVSADNKKIYVGNNDGTVSVIAASDFHLITTIPTQAGSHFLVMTPNGNKLYVMNFLANSVSVINTSTSTVIKTISVSASPQGAAVTEDGSKIYVALTNGNVAVINTATDSLIKNVAVGGSPVSVVTNTRVRNMQTCSDMDDDGLCDDWELYGFNGLDLPTMGAKPNHKDIFVEIDFMVDPGTCVLGVCTGHSHKPKLEAIEMVIEAFKNAPVSNPDNTHGINLHVDVGSESTMKFVQGSPVKWGNLSRSNPLPHDDDLSWPEFYTRKNNQQNFDPARARIFHYAIFAHFLDGNRCRSGQAPMPGVDLIVTLGGWDNPIGGQCDAPAWRWHVGSVLQQAGTFMHELGHNLGLDHGGGDSANHKPNYLSVMNYLFQTRGLIVSGQDGVLDYSRSDKIPPLDETHLNESVGLNGGSSTANYGTRWFCGDADQFTNFANEPINWNCNGVNNEADIHTDINNGTEEILYNYFDWTMLDYSGEDKIGQPLVHVTQINSTFPEELTFEEDSRLFSPYKVGASVPGELQAPRDTTITHRFTIRNLGGHSDTYTLSASSTQGWADLRTIPANVSLAPSASREIMIKLTIPRNAPTGAVDELKLVVRSQANSRIFDVASARTKIRTVTFLPSIRR